MILDLDIEGLGVIERASLPLGPGFTALTGETGAGKTMIVTALGLLTGGRAAAGSVRAGAAKAVVDGRWEVPASGTVADLVQEVGGDLDLLDEAPAGAVERAELIITRQVTAEGRSRATVGGRSAPAAVLQALANELVVVHGQADQLRLRTEEAQREALDAAGGPELARAAATVRACWEQHRDAVAERDTFVASESERAKEAVRLRDALAVIEPVDPQPGEDEALTARIERLTNREELRADVSRASLLMAGDETDPTIPGAASALREALGHLQHAVRTDDGLAEVLSAVEAATFLLDDATRDLGRYLADLDADGAGELEALHARLAEITELKRRFGPTLDDVLTEFNAGGARLLELEGDDERAKRLEEAVRDRERALSAAADALTQLREQVAEQLSARVTAELADLAMPTASLRVSVTPGDEIRRHGQDRIAFLFQPNPGQPGAPIQKAASGGELSRIMLALEVSLAESNPVPTFVFDEVDAGVGGAAAIEIGRRLQQLSERSQVIVVTHLAQVAAFASNHLRIEKTTDGQETRSTVTSLAGDDRTREIARLLSGLDDSDSGRAHAEELLQLAKHPAPAAKSTARAPRRG